MRRHRSILLLALLLAAHPAAVLHRLSRPGHAADRHDRQRHPLHRRPDRQRLRGLPLRRLPDLRAADPWDLTPRRPAGRRWCRGSPSRGRCARTRPPSGCSSCARASRSTTAARSTRTRWSSPSSRSRRRTRRTSIPTARGRSSFRIASLVGGHQDRRPHRGVRDQQADQLRALPDLLHGDRVADPVAEVQGLAQVRRAAVRHRPLQGDHVRAARAARARGQQEVLGRQAPAQDRQARAAADAGADHAAGRAAQRPGGLDRGAAARLDPAAQGRRASRSR